MAERDNFVPIKFPLYLGETREREVNGRLTLVQPFVEQWRIFEISSQTFTLPKNLFSKVHLGLRVQCEEDIIAGSCENYPDPIRLYRAMQFLNRFDHFPMNQDQDITLINRLYLDVADVYFAAGHNYPLRRHHFLQDRVKSFIGEQSFQEVLQMIPENLMEVVENLYRQKVKINGETLEREIRRGTVESTPLYLKIIEETRRRKVRDKKLRGIFWRNLWI